MKKPYPVAALFAMFFFCLIPFNHFGQTVFEVEGGGSYCEGTSPAGFSVSLSGSEENVHYRLKRNGVQVADDKLGTGDPIYWDVFTVGEYTVGASTNTLNWISMEGYAQVTEHPLPVVNCNAVNNDPVCIDSGPFELSGATPPGGTYSGNGVVDGFFDPGEAGTGTHIILYSYIDENDCTQDCSFEIIVLPAGQVNQPNNIVACPLETLDEIVFTTENDGNTTYTWENDNTEIGLGASGIGNIPSFTTANTATVPLVATISVTPSYENGDIICEGESTSFTITVNPAGQVNQPNNIVACPLETLDEIVFTTENDGNTTYTWENDNTEIGLGASGIGNIPSFTTANTATVPLVATITVTPSYENGDIICEGESKSFTITVNPAGQVNLPDNIVACPLETLDEIVFTTENDGNTTYTWENDNTEIGLGALGRGNIPSFTTANTATVPLVATITVTPVYKNEGVICEGEPTSFTITVNPAGQVNLPDNIVACPLETLDKIVFTTENDGNTTYTWENNNPHIGLGASGSGNIPSFIATNTATFPLVATITVTPSYENEGIICEGGQRSFTITVNPPGQVNQPVSQLICNGAQTQKVIFTSTNPSENIYYHWQNNNDQIGLVETAGEGNIPSFTAINDLFKPVKANIVVTPKYNYGGKSCPGQSISFTYTVNPSGHVNDSQNLIACHLEEVQGFTFTSENTGGNTSFAWESNSIKDIGLPTSGTNGVNSFTAHNDSIVSLTATITVTPTFWSNGLGCQGNSKTSSITVNPKANVVNPGNLTVCHGEHAVIEFATTNTDGNTDYSWENSNDAINLASSGDDTISFVAFNDGNGPVTAQVTVTPTYIKGGKACSGSPESFIITVNPEAHVYKPDNITVCNDDIVEQINFSSHNSGGTITYEWTISPNIGLIDPGGSNYIPEFTAVNTGTSPKDAVVTVTPTFTKNGVSCTGPAKSFTITVNPSAHVNKPDDIIVCHDGTVHRINFSSINTLGEISYYWESSIDIGFGTYGDDDFINAFTAINTGNVTKTAEVTVIPTFTSDGVSCTGPSKQFTITVNPVGQVNQPNHITVCHDGTVDEIIFSTNNEGGITTYYWESSIDIGAGYGGNGTIHSFTAFNDSILPRTAVITVTPTFTSDGVSCTGPSKQFTITVNPEPQVNKPADISVCHGEFVDQIDFSTYNEGGTTTYQWESDIDIGFENQGDNDFITGFTALNPGTSPREAVITVTPTFTNNGVACTGPSKQFTITVNPRAQVNKPADITVCRGGFVDQIDFSTSNSGGTTTYQWESSIDIGFGTHGDEDFIVEFFAINSGTSPKIAVITVTPTFIKNGVACTGPSKQFSITVSPDAQVDEIDSFTVCHGEFVHQIDFFTSNSDGTTTYQWSTKTDIGFGTNGDEDFITAFDAVNTGNSPKVAVITVTPTFTKNGVDCTGPSKSFTITVNPAPQVNIPDDISVCNGGLVNTIIFSTQNSGGSITYEWFTDTFVGQEGYEGNGPIPSFHAQNPGISPVIGVFNVRPTFEHNNVSCVADSPEAFEITVNPTPEAFAGGDTIFATSGSRVTFSNASASPNCDYLWTPGMHFDHGTNEVINPTTKELFSPDLFDFKVTNSFGCIKNDQIFVHITTEALATSPVASPSEICRGDVSFLDAFATGGSKPYTYLWTSSPPGFSSTIDNPVVYPEVTTTYMVTVTDASGTTATGQVVVVVNPLPELYEISLNEEGVRCADGKGFVINLSGSQTSADYHLLYQEAPDSQTQILTTATGTGNPLVFEEIKLHGRYRVEAEIRATTCSRLMLGSEDITVIDNLKASDIYVKSVGDKPLVLIYPDPLDNINYQWYRDGVRIEGETKQFYVLTDADRTGNKEFKVYISPQQSTEGLFCGSFSSPWINNYDQSGQGQQELFTVFPNPASSFITIMINDQITGDKITKGRISIMDMSGEEVFRSNLNDLVEQFDLHGFVKGIYFVSVNLNGKHTETQKIIIN